MLPLGLMLLALDVPLLRPKLVRTATGLEQWEPQAPIPFPATGRALEEFQPAVAGTSEARVSSRCSDAYFAAYAGTRFVRATGWGFAVYTRFLQGHSCARAALVGGTKKSRGALLRRRCPGLTDPPQGGRTRARAGACSRSWQVPPIAFQSGTPFPTWGGAGGDATPPHRRHRVWRRQQAAGERGRKRAGVPPAHRPRGSRSIATGVPPGTSRCRIPDHRVRARSREGRKFRNNDLKVCR